MALKQWRPGKASYFRPSRRHFCVYDKKGVKGRTARRAAYTGASVLQDQQVLQVDLAQAPVQVMLHILQQTVEFAQVGAMHASLQSGGVADDLQRLAQGGLFERARRLVGPAFVALKFSQQIALL